MPNWNERYAGCDTAEVAPARVLSEFAHLLPRQGRALDLACGLGANACLLARSGLQVEAWDSAEVAIARLRESSEHQGVHVRAQVRDIVAQPPPAGAFDVIMVSRFLERSLVPALQNALRPGGLLYYQTFVRDAVHADRGPHRPEYRLAANELLGLFPGLRVIVYREEGCLGDPDAGFRDEAYAVFQRPREID
ncbi:MAG: methyltransferase domain-containing protein [Acidihalobacter sp.]|uniref:class I SAM-dependent methyltransferase n=1 Tax=Acidihalobacter sp. TaxID=1872108 RepID=UPI00307F2D51